MVILALAVGVGVLLYSRRQELAPRLRLALRLAVIGYSMLLAWRLFQHPPEEDQLLALVAVSAALGLVWLGIWLAIRLRPRQAGPGAGTRRR